VADIIDDANDQAEMILAISLRERKPVLPRIGCCHNCEHPLPMDRLFCDADCAQDWEKREARR